ncbi:hypothetical protein Lal_00022642 [Lupinus albus]|uniref:Putative 3,9-dihydroxypterocarpan 6A-monooxygenase n=1 Tax=Lupinus albus TaxID=3870 RepID=A0A6A5PCL4_LUPAL|nr:putative 3,9-dihydroxypterocarpan 6A-monooxygenase [Lupinus albus]KAF1895144.1 hypothetical protein Lal_00022642 [Lupinus albus]
MAEFHSYIELFLIWLLSTILVRAILTRKWKKYVSAPSPIALPIIGHLHLISHLPHQSFHKLSIRYGPIMQIFLGSMPCVIVSNPEIAKEFLKTHETSFSDRFVAEAVHYLSYGSKGFLFAPYGKYWKFMKKLCVSELLGGRMLDQLLPVRKEETRNFMRFLKKKGESGEVVDVGDELLILTNNIISRMTMSRTCSESDNEAEDIRKMVKDTAELAGKFNISDFIWFCKNLDLQGLNKRLKGILNRFDTMMEKVIKEHEMERMQRKVKGEGVQVRDLLDILLDIQEDNTTEIKLTRENIKAFILDLFMAGTDTSALTTEWALSELINNPHVMEKAREEIDSVTGKSRLVEESDLPNLPYMRAIVKETLRIHPTAPIIGRTSTEKSNVCGYEIPAKSMLYINVWSMGRDPKLWDNPLEFRPERFIIKSTGEKELDVRGQNFQLMPFGTGRRVCPGASLALQFIPTNLAAMIQCFEWKVFGNGIVEMEEKPGMTLSRVHPLLLVPVPRLNPFPSID